MSPGALRPARQPRLAGARGEVAQVAALLAGAERRRAAPGASSARAASGVAVPNQARCRSNGSMARASRKRSTRCAMLTCVCFGRRRCASASARVRERVGQAAREADQAVAEVGRVAREQLVAALAGEHHRHVPRGEPRERPGRQHARVAERLVHASRRRSRSPPRRRRGPSSASWYSAPICAATAARSRTRRSRGRRAAC